MIKKFRLKHQTKRFVDIPMETVIENYCDFEHVKHVHKKCFKYANVIKKTKNVTLLEYGVYHIPPIPFVSHYIMLHEFIEPNKIVHISVRSNSRNYVKSEVVFNKINNGTEVTQSHEMFLSIFFKPFTKMLIFLADRWSKILWEEDTEIMHDRQLFIKSGKPDGSHCGKWVLDNGQSYWKFNKKFK